jgi:hypothetical protein
VSVNLTKAHHFFHQTKRAVLRFNSPTDVDIRSLLELLCIWMYSRKVFPGSVPLPVPMQLWLAEEVVEGEGRMLYYGFDFEEGLPQLPGSLQHWNRSDWPESLK